MNISQQLLGEGLLITSNLIFIPLWGDYFIRLIAKLRRPRQHSVMEFAKTFSWSERLIYARTTIEVKPNSDWVSELAHDENYGGWASAFAHMLALSFLQAAFLSPYIILIALSVTHGEILSSLFIQTLLKLLLVFIITIYSPFRVANRLGRPERKKNTYN